MDIRDLLSVIAKEFKDRNHYPISKTRLIKLAYLSEVYYKRITGRRLTNSRWVYWKYGPYLMDYSNILEADIFTMSEGGDFQSIDINPDYEIPQLGMLEKSAVSRAMDIADLDLNKLLDFVYFDTEPMIGAINRGEELDFECVKPDEAYSVKRLIVDEKTKRRVQTKIKAWKEKRRAPS